MSHDQSRGLALDQLTGCSLSCSPWWSASASFNAEFGRAVSAEFDASEREARGSLPIIDRKDSVYKALCALKSSIRASWEEATFPYTQTGIRLCPRDGIRSLCSDVADQQYKIDRLASKMDGNREDYLDQGRRILGRLFSEALYPPTWRGLFAVKCEERSIEPPTYLAHSNAEEYQRQLAARQAEIASSLQRFEDECWARLADLSNRIAIMLTPNEDGSARRIMSANMDGIKSLFDRTARLNFAGTRVFAQAREEYSHLLSGLSADELRDSGNLRAEVRIRLASITSRLAPLSQKAQSLADAEPIEFEALTV